MPKIHARVLTVVAVCALVIMSPTVNAAKLKGGDGDDAIFGTKKADKLSTGSATTWYNVAFGKSNPKKERDVLNGGPGADYLLGGPRKDTLKSGGGIGFLFDEDGTGGDKLIGGTGNDTIFSIDGKKDTISCGAEFDVVFADPVDVVSDDCEQVNRSDEVVAGMLVGNENNNNLTGTSASEQLFGLAGADVLDGNGGFDVLSGGRGADTINTDGSDIAIDDDGDPGDTINVDTADGEFDLILAADGAADVINCNESGSGFSEVYADPEDTVNDQSNCDWVLRITKGIGIVPG